MDAVIHHYLHLTIFPAENGEELVMRTLGARINTFVDVGANVGEWTALTLQYSASDVRGFLFEPGARAFQRLENRFADDARILLIRKAVSEFDGPTTFYEVPDCGESSSLLKLDPSAVQINVQVATLDRELSERLDGRRLDYLKIDAEGHDFCVIKGADRLLAEGRISYVQFEYNDCWKQTNSTLDDTIKYLQDRGFITYMIRPEGIVPFQPSDYGEFFFYSNFLAVHGSVTSDVHLLSAAKGS